MTAPLWVTVDDTPPRRLEIPGPYVVGRDDAAAVPVGDLRVSRTHAVVQRDGERWTYADGSAAGSFVDGARISTVAIHDGLAITLADPTTGPRLVFTVDAPARAPETATPRLTDARIVRIGRAPDNDIVVPELVASRYHAEIEVTNGRATLRDLGSYNGTFVDGKRITETVLTGRERVTLGATVLRLDGNLFAPVRMAATSAPALEAKALTVALPNGRLILDGVSFSLEAGKFLAVVGPTGAGKSTLLKAITGARPPDDGDVFVAGQDLYQHYEELRPTIGYVPQDDIVHSQLTVRQALSFGAELRFPPDSTVVERRQRIDEVMQQLGLTDRSDVEIARLSGGQRKRTSVALELLARPALMILDEPTSGLDPGFERAVMQLLRELADDGRAVIVVTHAVASLDLCDDVLFLAPGGRAAYVGPAHDALAHFNAPDYPAVFRALVEQTPPPRQASPPKRRKKTDQDRETPPKPVDWTGHLGTLIRRQFAVVAADRRNATVLAAAAIVPALLIVALVGSRALDAAATNSQHAARTLLGAIIVTASVLGAANGVREIVKEQALYQRERALGLSRLSYLASKVIVLGAVTAAQIFALVMIATSTAHARGYANLLPTPLELWFDASLAALATLMVGLLISAFVSTSEKAMALVPVMFVFCWLFSGVAIDLQSKPIMRTIGYAVPSNWGTAAAASTVDLPRLDACGAVRATDPSSGSTPSAETVAPCDARWEKAFPTWLTDVVGELILALLAFLAADMALALHEPLDSQRRQHLIAIGWRGARRRQQRRRRTRAS